MSIDFIWNMKIVIYECVPVVIYVNPCRDICIEMKENMVMWLIVVDSSNVTLHV